MNEPEEMEKILLKLNDIAKESKRVMKIKAAIGVGKIKDELIKVKESFEEAKEALSYRKMSQDGDVIYMEDIDKSEQVILLFDEKAQDKLFTAVKFGKEEDIHAVIRKMKEYLIKGFAMDDKRLKEMGGGGYWYELLNRIRDIRSSEKVLYRQVLDLYATSVDYDPKADESIRFFKIVQNKLHYAAHGHTAAEVIFERADAEKPFMGLTTFPGEQPRKEDVLIAKNYLNEKELKILNNLVSGYFDFAEIQAIKRSPMYMSDYIHHLDLILSTTGEQVLQNTGTISHEQAKQKALGEYQKYHVKTLSPVEKAYFDSIKKLTAETKKKKKK